MEAVQVKAVGKCMLFLLILPGTEILKVRDERGGGYDDFPGSRREEDQRNSYSAFDYSESSQNEMETGNGFVESFDLASVRRQFIR